jgi:hypothetical protein
MVQEGVQLLAWIPTYLAQRRALLDEHTSLSAPLQALGAHYPRGALGHGIKAILIVI